MVNRAPCWTPFEISGHLRTLFRHFSDTFRTLSGHWCSQHRDTGVVTPGHQRIDLRHHKCHTHQCPGHECSHWCIYICHIHLVNMCELGVVLVCKLYLFVFIRIAIQSTSVVFADFLRQILSFPVIFFR